MLPTASEVRSSSLIPGVPRLEKRRWGQPRFTAISASRRFGFVGRGLVTRGVQALFAIGFDRHGLHRTQLRAGVDNLRSRAVAKRLKMREEGVLRGAGKVGGGLYVDLVMYGLLVDEWQITR